MKPFCAQYHPQGTARDGLYLVERDGYDDAFLSQFIKKNCQSSSQSSSTVSWMSSELRSVAINDEIAVGDDDYGYLIAQLADYMEMAAVGQNAEDVLGSLLGIRETNLKESKEQWSAQITSKGTQAETQKQKVLESQQNTAQGESGTNSAAGGEETSVPADPRKNLTQMLRYPILTMIFPGTLSSQVLDKSSLSDTVPSEKNTGRIRGFMDYKTVTQGLDAVLWDCRRTYIKRLTNFLWIVIFWNI